MAGAFSVALLAVLAFILTFRAVGVTSRARHAMSTARDGVEALTSASLDDLEKEKAVQRAGLSLLKIAGALLWRLIVLVAAAWVPLQAASSLGLVPMDASLGMLLNVWFILGTTVILLGAIWVQSQLTGDRAATEGGQSSYSAAEQIIHMIAFLPAVQRALMWIDTKAFRVSRTPRKPKVVLITSIARGGTTACLNAFYSLEDVATTTYRDMPFITAPWLWSGCSRWLNRKTESRERAHGDGLKIELDSPEAFDEVLWKMLWPEKYSQTGISLWHAGDADAARGASLEAHMEKIAAIRGGRGVYVSKNNANIARLAVLPDLFPDCHIVVPIRHPAAHAASLLRQHRNFLQQQRADPFVKRYMEDIGHFEFGLSHRPILFPGFDPKRYADDSPDYWLAYWIAAFRHVDGMRSELGGRLQLVSQDDLRTHPNATVRALLDRSGLRFSSDADFAQFFRPGADRRDLGLFAPELLREAEDLFADLTGAEEPNPRE